MKRIISLMVMLCMLSSLRIAFPTPAFAATSGRCGDNLTWTLDDKGTLTISGTGTMDISIDEYDENQNKTRTTNFNNIELINELKYSSTETSANSEGAYVIEDADNNIIVADFDTMATSEDTYIVTIEDGYFDNKEMCFSKELHAGENAKIVAYIPDGYEFDKWESDCGESIFEDANSASTYICVPEYNVNIIAKVKESNQKILPAESIIANAEFFENTLTVDADIYNVSEQDLAADIIIAIYNNEGDLVGIEYSRSLISMDSYIKIFRHKH